MHTSKYKKTTVEGLQAIIQSLSESPSRRKQRLGIILSVIIGFFTLQFIVFIVVISFLFYSFWHVWHDVDEGFRSFPTAQLDKQMAEEDKEFDQMTQQEDAMMDRAFNRGQKLNQRIEQKQRQAELKAEKAKQHPLKSIDELIKEDTAKANAYFKQQFEEMSKDSDQMDTPDTMHPVRHTTLGPKNYHPHPYMPDTLGYGG